MCKVLILLMICFVLSSEATEDIAETAASRVVVMSIMGGQDRRSNLCTIGRIELLLEDGSILRYESLFVTSFTL